MYTLKQVRTALENEPLSRALYKMERFAQEQDLTNLAKWCQWELHGYPNGYEDLNEDEEKKIRRYRTVSIQWRDIYGRPLIVDPRLSFIQQLPIWIGVSELEVYMNKGCSYSHPTVAEKINEIATGQIGNGWLSPEVLQGLFERIRLQAQRNLDDNIPKTLKKTVSVEKEEWSWKRRLATAFAIFGGIWILLGPLFTIFGGTGPLASWGIWRYGVLIASALILTILTELIDRIKNRKKD